MRPKHKSRKATGTQARKERPASGKEPRHTSFTSFHYRALLDRLDVGVAILSGQGKILYSNPRFADMVGAPKSQSLIGFKLRSQITPGSWPALLKALERSRRIPSEGQLDLQTISGSRRIIRVLFLPLAQGPPEPLIAVTATEVTKLMEAGQALEHSERSLQNVSARLLQVQDDERRHMARDLHDTIGQELAVAVMRVEQIAKEIGLPEVDIQKKLADCSEWLRKIESETRTLSYVLHPPLLDQIGLVPALGWYVEGFSKRSGLDVQLNVRSKIPRLDLNQETALFRIVQESLTNVLRHSGSSEATVSVAIEDNLVCVSVEDKGKGFKNESRKKIRPELGVGIPGMRGRLRLVQGTLDIRSTGQGTTVSAKVPLLERGRRSKEAAEFPPLEPSPIEQAPAQPVAQGAVARILIADDHEIARRGIRDLFRDEPDMQICGEARDGVEALSKAEELHPDLLILDLSMPKMGGFSVAHQLRQVDPSVKILVYSTHSHPDVERMARTVGCRGCVHKANAARDLVRGAKAVLRGGEFYECRTPRSQPA